MTIQEVLTKIRSDEINELFSELYGNLPENVEAQKERYAHAVEAFTVAFPDPKELVSDTAAEDMRDISIFSAPGRTEICGNHTDHQRGRVLAAAVDLDAIAVVSPNGSNRIRILSEGYPLLKVDVTDYLPHSEEKETTASLVRGMVAQFIKRGVCVRGFDAYVTSTVLPGSGLSSSAAFEMLIGKIIDSTDNEEKAGAIEVAKYGQIAENEYFGKACGLMDQMVSSVGGFVEIDFKDPAMPKIDTHQCDLDKLGFSLVITDTQGSHAGLSNEYSAIPHEMRSVARFFEKEYLREVDEKEFWARISKLKKDSQISDRAILRSAHFFADDDRVGQEVQALDKEDFQRFLELVNESGESSADLLQNLFCTERPQDQEIPLALMLSRRIIGTKGACRVHGGGFAGTIQAFVPKEKITEYVFTLEGVFGKGTCHILRIRPYGARKIL